MKMNMIMGRCLFLMAIFLIPVKAFCFPEGKANVDSCREKLSTFFDGTWKGSPSERISSITLLGPHCSGSGAYELALSSAYLLADRYSEAEQAAQLGLAVKGADKVRLLHTIFRARADEGNWKGALIIANKVLEEFPKSHIGYLLKGKYFSGVGDFVESASYLEKANDITEDSECYQHLVIAYYNTNRFRDSVSAFERSMHMDSTAMLDINTVLAASASYYEVGNRRASLELLEKHAGIVPESRHNPVFIKMHNILMNGKKIEQ